MTKFRILKWARVSRLYVQSKLIRFLSGEFCRCENPELATPRFFGNPERQKKINLKVIWRVAAVVFFFWGLSPSRSMAQHFTKICPGSLTAEGSGSAGCPIRVNFSVVQYKDNQLFQYSVAFATQCTPRVGGTAGNNFVYDGNGRNHAPNDIACTGVTTQASVSTEDPAGICVPI